tara:strand:- start:2003 stop:2515 length:513 start_codon:yes stop_codon:yes gene_type:complete
MKQMKQIKVDYKRTLSNDVHEMYTIFGIEAARQTLIREIKEVMDEASEIDPRHVHLLVDMMTSKGILIPIDRNGMKLTNVGPLAKCSFEEADQQLYKAAIFSETDYMTGVSSNIMFGQVPPCGTGTVEINLNEQQFIDMLFENHDEQNIDEQSDNDDELKNIEINFDFDS